MAEGKSAIVKRLSADQRTALRDQIVIALEACRVAVEQRLLREQVPLTVPTSRLEVIRDANGDGWRSNVATVDQNVLTTHLSIGAFSQTDAGVVRLGYSSELDALSVELDTHTSLGAAREFGLFPSLTGPQGVLQRVLTPSANSYLSSLPSVSAPDPALAETYADELLDLAQADRRGSPGISEISLAGLTVNQPMTVDGVRLRPLTPLEQGAVLEASSSLPESRSLPNSRFRPTTRFSTWVPTVLLEVDEVFPENMMGSDRPFIRQVVLAFLLSGYTLSGNGVAAFYRKPEWSSFGRGQLPIPINEKMVPGVRDVTPSDLEATVKLARKIPSFGGIEGTGREVVLSRTLAGLGAADQQSSFLDMAIALEAALLSGITSELSFRFALYGALFLREVGWDPQRTFDQLKNIYSVRSKLVHGSRINAAHRQAAEQDASTILTAVVKKSVETGWPDGPSLDQVALLNPI